MLLLAAVISGGFVGNHASAEPPSSRSPFMPEGGGSATAAPTENAPLELRGIVSTKGGYLFGLYDPTKRQSLWVRQNEPGAEFTVRSHDVSSDTVTVDYQGRTLTLALKSAKVESLGPVPNPSMANMPRPPMQNQPQMGMTPSAADEARRLEGVAAEVRRRRMLRQAAQSNQLQQIQQQQQQQGQPPMPGPQPGAQPLPR